MNCKECGAITPKSYGGRCQRCYMYFSKGGMIHPLPPHGIIERDKDGKPICHICGRSFTRLGSHVRGSHKLTIGEYKARFGLCSNAKTTEGSYSKRMSDFAYAHKMPEQLIKTGAGTRVKEGENKLRKGKEVRLQERLDKRNRGKAKT